jgi:ribosome biogenesis protein Nip4
MMSEQKNIRNKWLHLRLSEAEYKKIQNGFSKSTKRKISDYVRSILLNKPITVYTRSKSLDDFISEMILLRSELNSIGNNFNQSVKRLHTLDEISEIKVWAILNEKSKEIFIKKVDEIKGKINQISDKWLQE